jgi:hypothetical protein
MPVVLEPQPLRIGDPYEEFEWPILPPTLLTVHRTSPADEQSRQIVVRLDGKKVVELLYGETLTIEIAPGPHTLLVHNTLMWRSVTFDAAPGGHVHFTVANRAGRSYYVLLLIIGVAPLYLMVERGAPGGGGRT